MFKTSAARLRDLIGGTEPVVAPLALDPLSAKLAEAAGFKAIYLGGGALGYTKTSLEACLSLTQMVQAAVEIRAACSLPLILDGQCGWGDAMHMRYTIASAEAAGIAAIEIEDQIDPKRAHHHTGIDRVIPLEHMVEKIKVAVATRRDPDFIIIGRTNTFGQYHDDLDEAARRAEAMREAGADMVLVPRANPADAKIIAERIGGPHVYMVARGISELDVQELGSLGYKLIIDSLTPFCAVHKALRLCYEAMAAGKPDPTVGMENLHEFELIHDLIDMDQLLDIERRTVEPG